MASPDTRVALVTGGAHRLGKAIVCALAHRGMRVAVHYHGSVDAVEATIKELHGGGVEAHAFRADLREAHAPQQLIDDVVQHFGGLDVLVNSAAIMLRTPVDEITPGTWDDIFALNVRAPFFLSQTARPHLAQARASGEPGVIVNIADLAAFETWPEYIPHGISKAGIVQMTRALARAFAPGIRVNAVAPGAVLLPDDWSETTRQHFARSTPLATLGSPSDVTRAVMYCIDAPYVTGDVLMVDGGRHVRR